MTNKKVRKSNTRAIIELEEEIKRINRKIDELTIRISNLDGSNFDKKTIKAIERIYNSGEE